MQVGSQAALLQAGALVKSIEYAASLEAAELNTLRAGVFLNQVWSDELITKEQFDELTRLAGQCLRDWLPLGRKRP